MGTSAAWNWLGGGGAARGLGDPGRARGAGRVAAQPGVGVGVGCAEQFLGIVGEGPGVQGEGLTPP